MRKYIVLSLLTSVSFVFSSCNDWLSEKAPGVTLLADFFSEGSTGVQAVNAAYVPLMWEFNQTYYPEWFMGDVVSDDALKGGQSVTDMGVVNDLEMFKTQDNNLYLLDYYRGQYQGVARCNLALQEVPKMALDAKLNQKLKDRLIGELKFLRAMYYFRLVRVFGGVPKVDFVVPNDGWKQPRASADSIYAFIYRDLEQANAVLWKKSEYAAADNGRATKGAAQALLMKAYLYNKKYDKAKSWGDSIMASTQYSLVSDYAANFTLIGENGPESVFEIQYMAEGTSDYGQGNGFSRGTFTVILTRSRNTAAGGWGFNKPTQNLYEEYESNDPRRDETILNPKDDEIQNPVEEIYLGSRYLNNKYAMRNTNGSYVALGHPSRGEINNKVIRYADVLLMYAEACCELGTLDKAKSALELVRLRARKGNAAILPAFPYGAYGDNQADLRKAIRHERRVELAMEGHRWFDLVRWGVAAEVMNAYRDTETQAVKDNMSLFVKGKHELFPIPAAELNRRNINSEVLIYLERSLMATKTSPTERLSHIEQLRANINPNSITPEAIEQAINSGRHETQ